MSRIKKYQEESLDLIDQLIRDHQGEIDSLLKEIEEMNLTGPTYAQYLDSFDASFENLNECSGSGIEPTTSKEQQKKALIELTQMGEPKPKTVEERALELYPIHEEFDTDRLKPLREAYTKGQSDLILDVKTKVGELLEKNESGEYLLGRLITILKSLE